MSGRAAHYRGLRTVHEVQVRRDWLEENSVIQGRDFMRSSFLKSCLLLVLLVTFTYSSAQTSSQKAKDNDSERGFTEVESLESTLNSQERLFKLDSNLGWAFNQHFGVFVGVPVYFVNVPSSTTTIGTATTTRVTLRSLPGMPCARAHY
jgi:hypothetical protein